MASMIEATAPTPRIELRRVVYNARLSQETAAFAADVWVNGKKAGTVQNEGTGGANRVSPPSLERLLEEHAQTLPPLPPAPELGSPTPLAMNAELLIGELLEEYLAAKDLKRLFRTYWLFVGKDERLYQVPKNTGARPQEPLNDMPFDAALRLYKTAGAK